MRITCITKRTRDPIYIEKPAGMIVCICHRVSDRDVERAALQRCPDFEAVQYELCLGRACGACADGGHEGFNSVCARSGYAALAASRGSAHARTQAHAHDGMR